MTISAPNVMFFRQRQHRGIPLEQQPMGKNKGRQVFDTGGTLVQRRDQLPICR